MVSHLSHGAGTYSPQTAGGPRITRNGMVTFASVMLFVLALFNGLHGIAAILRSSVFAAGAHLIVGDLRAWGWTMLALGIAQAIAGASVLRGGQIGRWFGVTVLGLNAFGQMWFAPAYPFWSLIIIALDVVAIWALCVYGGRAEEA